MYQSTNFFVQLFASQMTLKCINFEHIVSGSSGQDNRALHSKLFSEHSSQVSSRNEFLRVGTSSEKARKTCSDPNFWKTAISETSENKNHEKTQFFAIFSQKIAIFASSEMFGKHGNYQNISEIQKTAISETRENKNFGKNRLTQGLTFNRNKYTEN